MSHKPDSTMYSVQYTVYSIQCTGYSEQGTVYSVQYTVYSVQCTVYSVECTVNSEQSKVYSVQCTVHSPIQSTRGGTVKRETPLKLLYALTPSQQWFSTELLANSSTYLK